MGFLSPGLFLRSFRLQEAVGHGVHASSREVPGHLVQGVAVDGRGFAEGCCHTGEASAFGPWIWKTFESLKIRSPWYKSNSALQHYKRVMDVVLNVKKENTTFMCSLLIFFIMSLYIHYESPEINEINYNSLPEMVSGIRSSTPGPIQDDRV